MNFHSSLTHMKRASMGLQAAILAFSVLTPVLLLSSSADAAQLGDRFIDMSGSQTSEGSGRDGGDAFGQDVTYSVSFDLTSAHANLEGIVIDFCSNSPIIGDSCTPPTGFNVNEGSLAFTNLSGNISGGGFAINAATTNNTLILTDSGAGVSLTPPQTITFDLGSAAGGDGITNPTTTGTFYARIITYTDDTVAAAYADTVPGAHIDDGGIALSVANHLTVTARVQEVLEFCIGVEESSSYTNVAGDDCGDVAGTDLSLGVVDANSTQNTNDADIGASGSDGNDGVVMIRTNALNGAVVYYKAEQETSSGKLKQATQTCSGTSLADACFNSAGTTAQAIPFGTELFGMTLYSENNTSGGATTNALVCNSEYDGGTQACTGTATPDAFAWDDTGVFDTIASSTGPIDDEKALINFAATASPTTPTGLYTVTANFVATSTF